MKKAQCIKVFNVYQVSRTALPAGTSMEQKASRVSKSESQISATSPHVTDLAEDDFGEDQPKPM